MEKMKVEYYVNHNYDPNVGFEDSGYEENPQTTTGLLIKWIENPILSNGSYIPQTKAVIEDCKTGGFTIIYPAQLIRHIKD